MGSIPVRVAAALRDALGLARAVETGTFQGDGAYELSRLFPSVTTVELSRQLHAAAKSRLERFDNIEVVHGDSRRELPKLVRPDVPTLYFLDGHWCEGPTSGADDQCPLLDELRALGGGHPDDCIVIDDARFFLSAPPPPFDPDRWPSVVEVLAAVQAAHPSHHVAVVNDQIYAVPARARPVMDRFGQEALKRPLRRAVRRMMGDRLRPWSPARQRLTRVRRRLAAARLARR